MKHAKYLEKINEGWNLAVKEINDVIFLLLNAVKWKGDEKFAINILLSNIKYTSLWSTKYAQIFRVALKNSKILKTALNFASLQ